MVADIAAHRYLEAGEYNGNLYGTHLESVFEVSELGLHCLLDVGGPALRRLEAAGLPSIAILVLPETFTANLAPPTTRSGKPTEPGPPITSTPDSTKSDVSKPTEMDVTYNAQVKLARLIRHFSNYLTGKFKVSRCTVRNNSCYRVALKMTGCHILMTFVSLMFLPNA